MARPSSVTQAGSRPWLPPRGASTASSARRAISSIADRGSTRAIAGGYLGVGPSVLANERAMCWSRLFVRHRSVAGDCNAGFLYHQHLCGLQRHRTVQHPTRNRECHTGSQLHWVAILQFNAQATVDDEEELVLLLMLVPVVFAAREDA